MLGEEGVFMLFLNQPKQNVQAIQRVKQSLQKNLAKTFHSAPGRIIVSLYASNFIRIQQVFRQAQESYRKVAVVGKSLRKNCELRCES